MCHRPLHGFPDGGEQATEGALELELDVNRRILDENTQLASRPPHVNVGDRLGGSRHEGCEGGARQLDAAEWTVEDEPLLTHAGDIDGKRPSISAR